MYIVTLMKKLLKLISILIITALILTNSRSGILSIFYSTPILFSGNIFIPLLKIQKKDLKLWLEKGGYFLVVVKDRE